MEKMEVLAKKKEEIEEEINEMGKILKKNKNIGMHEPLTDADDYPRNDIDVYQVRHARQRIICLQNDHKGVMSEIENGLHIIHQAVREGKQVDLQRFVVKETNPFILVDEVTKNSAAEKSGLMVGDQIVQFGPLKKSTFTALTDLVGVVKEKNSIPIKLLRENVEDVMEITLNHEGKGLGCHVVPIR